MGSKVSNLTDASKLILRKNVKDPSTTLIFMGCTDLRSPYQRVNHSCIYEKLPGLGRCGRYRQIIFSTHLGGPENNYSGINITKMRTVAVAPVASDDPVMDGGAKARPSRSPPQGRTQAHRHNYKEAMAPPQLRFRPKRTTKEGRV
jgi:hypothetical protein